jgi:hypothetical protein
LKVGFKLAKLLDYPLSDVLPSRALQRTDIAKPSLVVARDEAGGERIGQ